MANERSLNAQRVAKHYAANRDGVRKGKLRARVMKGGVPQKRSLDDLGLTPADVNAWRAEAGLPALDYTIRPVKPTVTHVTPPAPKDVPLPSAGLLGKKIQKIESPISVDVSYTRIVKLANEAVGTEKTDQFGNVRKVTSSAVKNYVDKLRGLLNHLGCSPDEVVKCLSDYEKVSDTIKEKYAVRSRKDYYSAIVSLSNIVPEFAKLIGPELLRKYRTEMKTEQKQSMEVQIDDVDSGRAVPDINQLKRLLPAIKEKFGQTSIPYLASYFQVNLTGLRDDLGGVKILQEDAESGNFYNQKTGKMIIRDFKTSDKYDPYTYKLKKADRDLINKSLEARPRKYFIGNGGKLGPHIKKAFQAVGMDAGVNIIRHSQISSLAAAVKGIYGPRHRIRNSGIFKHTPATHELYIRPFRLKSYSDN